MNRALSDQNSKFEPPYYNENHALVLVFINIVSVYEWIQQIEAPAYVNYVTYFCISVEVITRVIKSMPVNYGFYKCASRLAVISLF